MTRQHTRRPVWTWCCDNCRKQEFLAFSQPGLPTADEMRSLGWSISPSTPVRDLCPACVAVVETSVSGEGS